MGWSAFTVWCSWFCSRCSECSCFLLALAVLVTGKNVQNEKGTNVEEYWTPTPYHSPSTTPSPNTCFEAGECIYSHLIEITRAYSAERCLKDCKNTYGCKWFTYKKHDGDVCELFSSCEYFSTDDCDSCISGEVSCNTFECDYNGVSGRCEVNKQLKYFLIA